MTKIFKLVFGGLFLSSIFLCGNVSAGNIASTGTQITAHDATPSSGHSGDNITIEAGDGDTNGDGGDIILTPGSKAGTGTPGRVGIGTGSPSKLLHVDGEIQIGSTGEQTLYVGDSALEIRFTSNNKRFRFEDDGEFKWYNGTSWTTIWGP